MTANVPFNPITTTNALGSFNLSSAGYIQGIQLDDPAIRFQLAGGVLAGSETIPMWGGVGLYELVAGNATAGYLGTPGGPNDNLGGQVGRATALTGSKALTGFSVFNQAHGMVNSPQSPVPLIGSLMQVNFVRLGSNARIAVKCDPVLASLAGTNLITQPVAWDFVNQMLIPQVTSIAVGTGNTYNSTTGVVTLNLASSPGISPGDTVTVAGLTGTGSFAAANGTFTAAAGTTGTVLKYVIATTLTLAINDSAGTVTTGAALTCKVLDINSTNSMVVSYDSVTGFATWNRSGACAVIMI